MSEVNGIVGKPANAGELVNVEKNPTHLVARNVSVIVGGSKESLIQTATLLINFYTSVS